MVPESRCNLKPTVIAAVLLLAWRLLRQAGAVWPRSVAEIVALTRTSRSQAYALAERLQDACAHLERPAGRPAAEAPPENALLDVAGRVRDFLFDNPGSVTGRGSRRHYSASFRRLVLELAAPDGPAAAPLSHEQLANVTGVPLGTLKDWLAPNPPAAAAPPAQDRGENNGDAVITSPEMATIVSEWSTWNGNFGAFCQHLREHQRIERGNTFINSILRACGLRHSKPRNVPPPPWTRDTFIRLFPGAQWLGDGNELAIWLNGAPFVFNLEAVHDVASDATVGRHVSDAEDEDAVLAAFQHGRTTTGDAQGPVGFTVDGKPCNHTPGVAEGIAPTTLVPATPARGQAKAPLEGAFGLFSQTAPPLVVNGRNPRELARSILALVTLVWAFARNGRPRARLGGLSPAAAYLAAKPSPEQLAAARAHVAELCRRHERFRQTRERRADPKRRDLLRAELERLGIDDPDGRTARDLASFSLEAILRGLATYAAKQDLGTLTGIDEPRRYLGGIIRNLDGRLQLERMAHHLLAIRLRHGELSLAPLQRELARFRQDFTPEHLPHVLTKRALDAEPTVDFRFFARAAQDALARLPRSRVLQLFPALARRVAAAFSVDPKRRDDLIAQLSAAVLVADTERAAA